MVRSALAGFFLLVLAAGCAPAATQAPAVASRSPVASSDAPAVAPTTGSATLPLDREPPASAEQVAPAAASDAAEASSSTTPMVMPGQRDGRRVVVLDPGHGGPEGGSGAGGLVEKTLNLRIALFLETMLERDGYEVVLTRRDDGPVWPGFTNPGERPQVSADLPARIDIANEARADVFVSIHNNGSGSASERGTEVWYSPLRPFADRNEMLATAVLNGILSRLQQAGHPAFNRGIKSDEFFRVRNGVAFNLYVLGPGNPPRPHVPTLMPGVLGESLFQSNPVDAAALRRPEVLQAIARGYYDGITAYFQAYPDY